jgi:hypothetical protein
VLPKKHLRIFRASEITLNFVVIANHLRIPRPLIHYSNNNNLKNKIKIKNTFTLSLSLGGAFAELGVAFAELFLF